MIFIIGIIGFVIGLLFSFVIAKIKSATGVIYIDQSNPERDSFLFDIQHIDTLYKKKKVVLRVDRTKEPTQQ